MKTTVTVNERPGPRPVRREQAFNEILVPTDFSSRSARAENYAVGLAKLMEAHLTLLHVVPAPYGIDYTLGGIPNGEWEAVRQRADEKLATALRRAKMSYEKVDGLFRVGSDLYREIAGAVSEVHADLVILSTHGYKGWKLLVFGSDADELLLELPCPVLVVR